MATDKPVEKKWPTATDPNPNPTFKPEEQAPEHKAGAGEPDQPLGDMQPHVNPHAHDAPSPTSPVGEGTGTSAKPKAAPSSAPAALPAEQERKK